MTTYVVTAPLVQVATDPHGVAVQVTKGGTVPDNVTKVALDNLIELGYVEKEKPTKAPKPDKDDDSGKDKAPAPGTVEAIVAEVGEDPEKAAAALDAEKAGKDRTSLVSKLEAIIAAATSPAGQGD